MQLDLNYSPAANLTGATISAYVYLDPSLIGSGVQVFTQSGAGSTWNSGGFVNITAGNAGTWVLVTWPATFADSTQVEKIGLQFYNVPIAAVGNIYIDDIAITFTNTPTQTSTSSITNTVGGFTSTPTTTPTVTSTPTTGGGCTLLLNGCETLTVNGSWTNQNGTIAPLRLT